MTATLTTPKTTRKLRWVAAGKLTELPARTRMYMVLRDQWWTARRAEDDELYLAFFGHGSPQCNPNETIVRHMHECIDYGPNSVAVFLPVVYLPVSSRDYAYEI